MPDTWALSIPRTFAFSKETDHIHLTYDEEYLTIITEPALTTSILRYPPCRKYPSNPAKATCPERYNNPSIPVKRFPERTSFSSFKSLDFGLIETILLLGLMAGLTGDSRLHGALVIRGLLCCKLDVSIEHKNQSVTPQANFRIAATWLTNRKTGSGARSHSCTVAIVGPASQSVCLGEWRYGSCISATS